MRGKARFVFTVAWTNLSIGLTGLGALTTAFLILLLAVKEVASASELYDTISDSCLNVPISALLIVFAAIVLMKTLEILY